MKASIFGWCLTEGREVLQLAGACFFMHQIHHQIIVFCPPHICHQVIDNFDQLYDDIVNCKTKSKNENIYIKRVTIDPSLWSGEEMQVIEVMDQKALQELDQLNDEFKSKSGKKLQRALI